MAAAFLHFTQQTQLNRKEHKRQKAAKMQVIIWKAWKQPSMPDWLPQGTDFHWLYCCLLNHKGHWRPPPHMAILLPVPGVYLWSTVPLCLNARDPHPIQPFSALSLESTCSQQCRSLSHCPQQCTEPVSRVGSMWCFTHLKRRDFLKNCSSYSLILAMLSLVFPENIETNQMF